MTGRKQFLGGCHVGVYATPERPQSVQRIIQDCVFFNMIRGRDKQLSDPKKNRFLGFLNTLRNLIPVIFEERSVVKSLPSQVRGIVGGHSSAHKHDP
jgi:hypothetical protein